MEDIQVYDLAQCYAKAIADSPDFKRFLFLKTEINSTLQNKIDHFKTSEALFEQAKKYGKYYPEFEKIRNNFVKSKKELYQEPIVQEFKTLEQKIQALLNQDLNELKQFISNKFDLTRFF